MSACCSCSCKWQRLGVGAALKMILFTSMASTIHQVAAQLLRT